jgi:HSP20 family protein
MTLIRWNPERKLAPWHPVNNFTGEFFNMHREIDRLLDRLAGDVTDDGKTSTWLPVVDVLERDDAFEVRAELPGIKKEDVKITLRDDILTIRGEKKQESEKKEQNYHRVERSYGSFQRSFALPASVQGDKIDATYHDGVLTVVLPKSEEAKPRDIEVKVK